MFLNLTEGEAEATQTFVLSHVSFDYYSLLHLLSLVALCCCVSAHSLPLQSQIRYERNNTFVSAKQSISMEAGWSDSKQTAEKEI